MMGRERQTVADLSVEHCGSAEAMFVIARHNNISVDKETAGMGLTDESVTDRRTAEYIQGQGVSPANMYENETDVLTDDTEDHHVMTETDVTIEC